MISVRMWFPFLYIVHGGRERKGGVVGKERKVKDYSNGLHITCIIMLNNQKIRGQASMSHEMESLNSRVANHFAVVAAEMLSDLPVCQQHWL